METDDNLARGMPEAAALRAGWTRIAGQLLLASIPPALIGGALGIEYTQPMQPIVLAHGYLGFAEFFGLEYFRGVRQHLTQMFNVQVAATMVPPRGAVPDRAALLEEEIHQAFGQPVHVIAHSMGGLDARYLLLNGKARYPGQIASLTTVSTPHSGTYLADLVVLAQNPDALFDDARFRGILARMVVLEAGWLAQGFAAAIHPRGILSTLGYNVDQNVGTLRSVVAGLTQQDAAPLLQYLQGLFSKDTAIEDLTVAGCRKIFDGANILPVPCFSYPGTAAPFATLSPLFLLSWMILEAAEGDNDGLVSVRSASLPAVVSTLSADHAGVIGWGADCLSWYEGMVRNIQANVPNA